MTTLEPDRDQLEIFVKGTFRHCGNDGVVSLRAFFEDANKNDPPYRITATSLKGGLKFLVEAAEDDARRAANHPRPLVFCPPVAVFASAEHAREIDLLEGPVLAVELDKNPRAALATLEHLLGFATLVVRSGGEWTNPTTGEIEHKLHAYWRLKEPARGKEALDKLKKLRRLITDLVGGDPTNIPINHPIRWPGSWHRKGTPRLCQIADTGHLDNEIDLDDALAAIEAVAPQPGPQPDPQPDPQQGRLDWSVAFGKIISGEQFHPALVPLSASFATWGIPQVATRGVLRALLTNTQTNDPERLRRRDVELGKLPDTVRSGYEKFAATPTSGALFDPWQEFIVPPFPLDILPDVARERYGRRPIGDGDGATRCLQRRNRS